MLFISLFIATIFIGCESKEDLGTIFDVKDKDNIEYTLAFIKKAQNPLLRAQGNFLAGLQYKKLKVYDKAFSRFKISYEYYTELNNPVKRANCLQIIGNVLRENKCFLDAISYYDQAIKVNTDIDYVRKVEIWKGKCYRSLRQRDKARELLVRCGEHWKDKDSYLYGESLLMLGLVHLDYGIKNNSTSSFKNEAFSNFTEAFNALAETPYQSHAVNNLGNCYLKTGKFKEAEVLFDSAIRMNNDSSFLVNVFYLKGELYKKKGDFESAVSSYIQSNNFNTGDNFEFQESYKSIIAIHNKLGDFKASSLVTTEYFERNKEHTEKLSRVTSEISDLKFQLLEEKDKNKKVIASAKENKLWSYIEIGSLSALLLGFTIGICMYLKRRANRLKEIIGRI